MGETPRGQPLLGSRLRRQETYYHVAAVIALAYAALTSACSVQKSATSSTGSRPNHAIERANDPAVATPQIMPPATGAKMATYAPAPQIPPSLAIDGLMLSNLLKICVSRTGDVTDVTMVETSDPQFDDACKNAFMRWKFKPLEMDGKVVPFCYFQKNVFKVSSPRDRETESPQAAK